MLVIEKIPRPATRPSRRRGPPPPPRFAWHLCQVPPAHALACALPARDGSCGCSQACTSAWRTRPRPTPRPSRSRRPPPAHACRPAPLPGPLVAVESPFRARFSAAAGATELQRGWKVAHKIALLAVSNVAERGIGSRGHALVMGPSHCDCSSKDRTACAFQIALLALSNLPDRCAQATGSEVEVLISAAAAHDAIRSSLIALLAFSNLPYRCAPATGCAF